MGHPTVGQVQKVYDETHPPQKEANGQDAALVCKYLPSESVSLQEIASGLA